MAEDTNTLKPFTITRSTWLRGEGGARSALLRPEDGKMCCLGQFLAKVHNVRSEALVCMSTPYSLHKKGEMPLAVQNELLDFIWHVDMPTKEPLNNNGFVQDLMAENDSEVLEAPVREQRIREGFARLGYAVSFED